MKVTVRSGAGRPWRRQTFTAAGPLVIIAPTKDAGAPEEAAQGKNDVSFYYPENANHVLKHELRPREELTAEPAITGYNGAESMLDPETLWTTLEWLGRQSE